MTIEELAELQKDGFAGVHQRLDGLNGRTRRVEQTAAGLVIQAGQLEAARHNQDERLRATEVQAAVGKAYIEDLRKASHQGIKWGAIASAVLTVTIYAIGHIFGFDLPR